MRLRNVRQARRVSALAIVLAVVVLGGCDSIFGGSGDTKNQKASSSQDKKANKKPAKKKGGGNKGSQAKAGSKSPDKKGDSKGDNTDNQKAETEPPKLDEPPRPGSKDKKKPEKRNPFASGLEVEEDKEPVEQDEGKKKLGPLQRHAVKSYRLAGIISEVAIPKAMFIDPEGTGHLLKEGDELGKKGGVVKDVRDNEVAIEIPPEGDNGKPRTLTVTLREAGLPSEEDEGLTDEEKKTLERLLESEQGRKAVRDSYQNAAPGASAAEQDRQRRQNGQRSSGSDGRFPGLEPPE